MFARRTDWNLKTNRYSEVLNAFRNSQRPLLDLTASNPTEIGLQYESEKLLHSLANVKILEYEPAAKGLLSARQAVASYYAGKGVELSPEHLFLTVSTSEAYSYCFRLLCDPGDEVLIPQPSYPLFEFLADLLDVKLKPYELIYDHGWQVDFHALECAITDRTRAVLVVHPNNPTGSFLKLEEKKLLSRICSERDLAIVADEVFLDYALGGLPPLSFAGNREVLTFTLSGLSKISGLPQMKVAWIAVSGPAGVVANAIARLDVIADTYLSMNAPVQWALPQLLESRIGIQHQLNARISQNLSELDAQLCTQTLCSRLAVEGGWYAVLRVPATRSDEDLAVELLEREAVLVHPGHFYDFPSDGYLVLSLITPTAAFADGVRRLFALMHR
jgi:alanine-synthesizing transaminase